MTLTNLRMVVCNEFGVDDTQKMFGIFACKDNKRASWIWITRGAIVKAENVNITSAVL